MESSKIYEELVATAAQDSTIKVCIQGYPGAFHEMAARCAFENVDFEVVPANTFEELISRVMSREIEMGIMAIENTLGGSLMYNYNLINESHLTIVGEVYLRIKQNLMVLPGQKIEQIREVRSHPMALAQCRAFFRKYPQIKLVETIDTALSAKEIKEEQLFGVAGVASTLAAEKYDLEIIQESIETNKKNHTRFLLLRPADEVGMNLNANKVSLCFSANHEVGSLHNILAVLAAYGLNLTKIQSRPINGRPWEYLFFVDFVVNGSVGWKQAVEAIRPIVRYLKVLGAYPTGRHFEY